MGDVNLIPSSFANNSKAESAIFYPKDDAAVDKMTRSVLGVCHYLVATAVNKESHQAAELINAYTGLYRVYIENKKPCADESAAEPDA